MKKINLFICIISLFTFSACAKKVESGYYKGYELPPYQVYKQIDNIEFRQYQSRLIAQVEVKGDRKEAAKKGFMILARYIFGKNSSSQKVAMTSPVLQENTSQKIAMTSPVNQIKQGQQKWLIQFGMPKEYKIKTLPKPKDERIKFKITKKKKAVVIRFAGLWSDKKFANQKANLEKFIADNKIKTKGEPIIAYYDDLSLFRGIAAMK